MNTPASRAGALISALLMITPTLAAQGTPQDELLRLWRDEPTHRADRRAAFAELTALQLVALHREGDADARDELVEVARLVESGRHEVLLMYVRQSTDAQFAASARVLARAAGSNLPADVMGDREALTTIGGSSTDIERQRAAISRVLVSERSRGLIALAPLLNHEDPRVRARIAHAIRSKLLLPIGVALSAWTATDPALSPPILTEIDEGIVRRVVVPAVATHGTAWLVSLGRVPALPGLLALSDESKRLLHDLLWAMVVAPREEPRPGSIDRIASDYRIGDMRHWDRQGAALAILRVGGSGAAHIWRDARATARREVKLPVLAAMAQARVSGPDLAAAIEDALGSPDPAIAAAAAHALAVAVSARPDDRAFDAGRLVLAKRAQGLVQVRLPTLRVRWRGLNHPSSTTIAAEAESDLVLAACAVGATELFATLLDALREHRASTESQSIPPQYLHTAFLVAALARLSTHLGAAQSGDLFDVLEPRIPRRGRDESISRALGGMMATLPPDRWARYAAVWWRGRGDELVAWVDRSASLDPERARWLATLWPVRSLPPRAVLVESPERLAIGLRGEDSHSLRRPAETELRAICAEYPARVRAWFATGGVSRSAIVSAVAALDAPDLELFETVARATPDDGVEKLAAAVSRLDARHRDSLRRLADAPSSHVVAAAARRLAELGDEDREFAVGVFIDFVGSTDPLARALALEWACTAGIRTPALLAAARGTSSTSRDRRERAAAAALRLQAGELEPRQVFDTDPGIAVDALVGSGVEITAELLREVARDDARIANRIAGRRGSHTPTLRAVLEATEDEPSWVPMLEDVVRSATWNPDPEVRAAAYRIMRRVDPRDWPLAVLAGEAVLDDDPLVREAGR